MLCKDNKVYFTDLQGFHRPRGDLNVNKCAANLYSNIAGSICIS